MQHVSHEHVRGYYSKQLNVVFNLHWIPSQIKTPARDIATIRPWQAALCLLLSLVLSARSKTSDVEDMALQAKTATFAAVSSHHLACQHY